MGASSTRPRSSKDGRVLVVGGWACVFDGCFDPPPWWYVPAEIFDPSTNTWTPIAGPYLSFHTATLLNDGRVLVPGCPSMVFDPATGTWIQTGNMFTATEAPQLFSQTEECWSWAAGKPICMTQ